MATLTHFDEKGNAVMVDVGEKDITSRVAVAKGCIHVSSQVMEQIQQGSAKKGDVLGVARVAGIMAAKRTSELIPLCHLLQLTYCGVEFTLSPETNTIEACCTVKTTGKTGVEMEALTGVQIALLTIYDMCKGVDRSMWMDNIRLCHKDGGQTGVYHHD